MLTAALRRPASDVERQTGAVVCVDLDGTLIAGDLLWESFVELLKRRPWQALGALLTLFRGKACFKRAVAQLQPINAAALPYREVLLADLQRMHLEGTALVLATASDETCARAVANHLGIFSDVIASDGRTNLSGRSKAAALVARYGRGGFSYIGNGWADVPVWREACAGHAVAAPARLLRHAARQQVVQQVTEPAPGSMAALIKAMRPYQWVKNLLVFVPLIASHSWLRLDRWWASALTFVVFSLCASAIYLLNDISDIPSDRLHPRKRRRPFAAGHLSIPAGTVAAIGLLAPALILSITLLSWQLALIAVAYVIATTAYSLVLKRIPVADVFALTGLYVLRVAAGGVATGIALSSWLLAFALFLFLSLAFVKRYAELLMTNGAVAGRGYCADDLIWMHAIGTSAGYMAVLVLALYLNAPEVAIQYARPQALWFLCPLLLFWITRMWFRAGRRIIHDDPVMEALKDPATYVIGGSAVIAVITAL